MILHPQEYKRNTKIMQCQYTFYNKHCKINSITNQDNVEEKHSANLSFEFKTRER